MQTVEHDAVVGTDDHEPSPRENWKLTAVEWFRACALSSRWLPARPSAASSWPPGRKTRSAMLLSVAAVVTVAFAEPGSEAAPKRSTRTSPYVCAPATTPAST